MLLLLLSFNKSNRVISATPTEKYKISSSLHDMVTITHTTLDVRIITSNEWFSDGHL